MSKIVLSENFMPTIIKGVNGDVDGQIADFTLQTFKNNIDPDPASDTTQFEGTTYAGAATPATFTMNGPAKNLDGEWHLICLAGVNRSNSDMVASGPIYGYWVKCGTGDGPTLWFAEKFDEPINLPIGGLLNLSPDLIFPLVNGSAGVER